jgi:hypothetical protein
MSSRNVLADDLHAPLRWLNFDGNAFRPRVPWPPARIDRTLARALPATYVGGVWTLVIPGTSAAHQTFVQVNNNTQEGISMKRRREPAAAEENTEMQLRILVEQAVRSGKSDREIEALLRQVEADDREASRNSQLPRAA